MQNKEIGGRAVKLELAKKREALKQGERRGGAKRPAPGVTGGPGGPGGARAERVEPAERKRTQPSTDTARAAESTPKAQPANSAAPVNSTDDKAAKKKLAKRNARLARKEGKLRRSKGADAAKAVGTKPVVAPTESSAASAAKPTGNAADDDAASKDGRLIIRNLSFHCTEDELRDVFAEHGDVTDVRIPKNAEGRARGFGFVQFVDRDTAEQVVQASESLAIRGRPVAVDFSVPKTKYVEMQQAQQANQVPVDNSAESLAVAQMEEQQSQPAKPSAASSEPDNDGDDSEQEDDSEEDSDDSDSGSDDSEESEDSDSSVDSGDEETDGPADDDDDDDDDDDEDDDDEESEDDDEEDEVEKPDKTNAVAQRQPDAVHRPKGVGLDNTVFCRNVLFETEESAIRKAFNKFGKIRSVKIVVDPVTQRPRGTAFVNFFNPESVEAAIKEANAGESFHASKVLAESSVVSAAVKQGGIIVDGRRLLVTAAISRDDASKLKAVEPKTVEVSDKRNLYLAAEGVIREGDPAASFLSPSELALRANAERIKAQKLRDPSHFVSRTRLCVRNLPLTCDERQLKNVFLRACESNADRKKKVGKRIVSVFIVRDKATGRTVGGVARSRGYGFINFAEHEDALFSLRALNNSQTTFEDRIPGALSALGAPPEGSKGQEQDEEQAEPTARSSRRLVVEFAVENAKALSALEKRKQRAETTREQLRTEERASAGHRAQGQGHGAAAVTVSNGGDPAATDLDLGKTKRKRKQRLSKKNRPNAVAKEAAAAAAAAAAEAESASAAPAPQKRKRQAGPVMTGDDKLASMDVEGDPRTADEAEPKKRNRRGQKKQQRRDKNEESALQDMIDQYKSKYY